MNEDIVPSTIEEAVNMIVGDLSEEDRKLIEKNPPESSHFFGGMRMRNNWSLWEQETPIKRDAVEKYKIAHADDLSGLIMEWVWAKAQGKEFDPQKHCQRYHEHWKRYGMTSLRAGRYHDDGTPMKEDEQ